VVRPPTCTGIMSGCPSPVNENTVRQRVLAGTNG
jgi:hypothetical protein